MPCAASVGSLLDLGLDRRHTQVVLELQHLVPRGTVTRLVRPVGVGWKVDVRHRDDAPRLRLDEDVEPVRAGRVDDREARDVRRALAVVPAELLRNRARVHRRLLQADDVGARGADRGNDLVERLRAPGRVLQNCRVRRLSSSPP